MNEVRLRFGVITIFPTYATVAIYWVFLPSHGRHALQFISFNSCPEVSTHHDSYFTREN